MKKSKAIRAAWAGLVAAVMLLQPVVVVASQTLPATLDEAVVQNDNKAKVKVTVMMGVKTSSAQAIGAVKVDASGKMQTADTQVSATIVADGVLTRAILTTIDTSVDASSTGITAANEKLTILDTAVAACATSLEAVRAALAGAVQASTFTTGTGWVAGAATADDITLWAAGSGATTIKGVLAWVNGCSTDFLDFSLSATGGSIAKIATGNKFRVQANIPILLDRLNFAVVAANAGTIIYGKVSSPNMVGGFKVLY